MSGREAARKSLHVALGAGVFAVPCFESWELVALLLLAALVNLTLLPVLPWTRWLLREEGSGARTGLVLYPLVLAVLFLLFRDDPRPAICGWLGLALADGLAPFLALGIGGPRWPWARRKRVFPSLAAALVAALAMSGWVPVATATLGGLGALVGESVSGPIDDNLSCPALAAGGACLALGAF